MQDFSDNISPFFEFLNAPTPVQVQHILALYREAGWWLEGIDDVALISKLVVGSFRFLAVSFDGEIVGMGRVISDGVSDAYIQDVTVKNELRGRGIGTRIIEILVESVKKEGIRWIGLIAERGSSAFYARIGFTEMPNATPMTVTVL